MGQIFNLNKENLKELISLALPMIVSQGAFAVMIFTDRFFMSQISTTHIAAAMGGGITSFFCISFFIGLISYSNAMVAQFYGAKRYGKCSKVVTQSLLIAALSWPILLLVGYLVGKTFSLIGHSPVQVALEIDYFYILIGCSVITLSKSALSSYFSGIGKTKNIMVADVAGMLFNIPLSYMLVFGKFGLPSLGLVGAGIGTVVSSAFSLMLFVLFYFGKENREKFAVLESFKLDRTILKPFLRLGSPSGLEMLLNTGAFNLFVLLFQAYGISQAASIAIVFNWDVISFIPMVGLNIAIMSLVGRAVGAGNIDETKKVIYSGFLVGGTYALILGLIFIGFRSNLVDIFANNSSNFAETRNLAIYMMIGLASYVMFDAVVLVSSGVLRGVGDTRWLMVASTLLHWVMLISQIVIIKFLNFGPKISWIGFVLFIMATAVIYLFRLKGQKWKNRDVMNMVAAEEVL